MRDNDPSPLVAFHPAAAQRAIAFGDFRFDRSDKVLRRGADEIRLPPRVLSLLEYFLERPQRIISKRELLDVLSSDAFVSESSLTEAIGVLRQALGDSASQAQYIQTVHRRGYRFVAPIAVEAATVGHLSPVAAPLAPADAIQPPLAAAPVALRRTRPLLLVATAVLIAAAGALAWWQFGPRPRPRVLRATITLPAEQAPAPGLSSHSIAALSPDGQRIVYVAGATGDYRLYLRAVDRFDAVPVPGGEGGHAPFFSPDGRSIGFFRQGRLLVMALPDAEPLDLGPSGAGQGGWWHEDGTIVFATGSAAGIQRVAATGGAAVSIPLAAGDLSPGDLRHPTISPDGRTLFATWWKQTTRHSEVVAIDLASGNWRSLGRGTYPRLLPDGTVIHLRDEELIAVPGAGGGPERVLLSGVMTGLSGAGQFAVTREGTLLYVPHAPERLARRLTEWSAGTERTLPFEQRPYQNVAVSPDGQRIATTIYDRGASDLWVGDPARGALTRLTVDGAMDPAWSPDGASILFATPRDGMPRMHRVPANGSASPAVISPLTGLSPTAEAPDGSIFANRRDGTGNVDILKVSGSEREAWAATKAHEAGARLSPDGQWVVFESNRSGRMEIYVRRPSGSAEDLQVSTEGGTLPGWSQDGGTIWFMQRRRVLRAGFDAGRLGRPELVVEDPTLLLARPRGEGLILIKALEEARPLTTLHIVFNWFTEVSGGR